jgi:hypothetical protein
MAPTKADKASTTRSRELRVKKALDAYRDKEFRSIAAAAKAFGLNRGTLSNRWHHRRQDRFTAHESQRLLSNEQENALTALALHLSAIGQPLSRRTLGPYVDSLCGKYPSQSWIDRFLHDNQQLANKSPNQIDPKRAQAFNRTNIRHHFDLFAKVMKEHNISMRNLYNMDEKGVQLGGGRKNHGSKFICGQDQHTNVKLRSSNLELVTVVECISADGASIRPSFVLSGKAGSHYEHWFDERVGS